MNTQFNRGDFVVVYSLFCGDCNNRFEGLFVGVVEGQVPETEVIPHFGPTPQFYIGELTCPSCNENDLYGGEAIYSYTELIPATDDVMDLGEVVP